MYFGPGYWDRIEKHYRRLEAKLRRFPKGDAGNIPCIRRLIALLILKIQASLAVTEAYATRNRKKTTNARKRIAQTIRAVKNFEKQYRELWYARNKTFGYEVMQIRLAGQIARLGEHHS